MPLNIRELIVVLGISGLVFALGKGTALHFMDESDFKRRRSIWMLLSAAAFLSPNFWLFAVVAAPTLYWGGRKDTNPLAFYLLLMTVIPSVPIQIPTDGLGINRLFSLNITRLLAIFVLLPTALRLCKTRDRDGIKELQAMDLMLIAYGVLEVIFFVPPDLPGNVVLHNSLTNTFRDAFLFVIDTYLLYYVASRSCSSRKLILDALATFCIACTVMAAIATFEMLKGWPLYIGFIPRWGGTSIHIQGGYVIRAGLLRAEASSANPLVLGYLLAIAFSIWLYLQMHLSQKIAKIGVTAVLWFGLLATFSRGPWLGAVLVYFAYAALRPGSASKFINSTLIFLAGAAAALASPLGKHIADALPFFGGNVANNTLAYRERLLDRSWQLIQEHPLLGDQHALFHMQNLRQGQGIIDVVNTYVGVTLFHGFVGLGLFVALILTAFFKVRAASRKRPPPFPDAPELGAALEACIIGTLFILADCSFILGLATMFYVLAGLSAAYAYLCNSAEITFPHISPKVLLEN